MPEITTPKDVTREALINFLSAMKKELEPIAKTWTPGKKHYASLHIDDDDGNVYLYVDELHNDEDDVEKPIPFPNTSKQHIKFYQAARARYNELEDSDVVIPYLIYFYYGGEGEVRVTVCSNVVDDVFKQMQLYQTAKAIANDLVTLIKDEPEIGAVTFYEGDDDGEAGFTPGEHLNYDVGIRVSYKI